MWALLTFVGGECPHLSCSHGAETYLHGESAGVREQPGPVACCGPDLQEKCVVYAVNQLGPCSEWLPHPRSVPTTSKELVQSSQRGPLLNTKAEISPWGSQRVFYNGTLGKPEHQTKLLRALHWLRWTRAPVASMG